MKKIFLFNGPPGSGKDTAAALMKEHVGNVFMYKMAFPLKEGCHKLLGLPGTLEDLEPAKEIALRFGLKENFLAENETLRKSLHLHRDRDSGDFHTTLRQFYIHVSENMMKPLFGDTIFGKLAIEYIKNDKNKYVAISDTGFASEVAPLLEYFGKDSFVLVRLHRDGSDFANDSRSYIHIDGVKSYDINNNGTLEALSNSVVDILEDTNVALKSGQDHYSYKPELDHDL